MPELLSPMGGIGWRLEGLFPLAADSGQTRDPGECGEREQKFNTNQNNNNNKNHNEIKNSKPKSKPCTSSLAPSAGGVLAADVFHKVRNDKNKNKKQEIGRKCIVTQ